MSGVPVETIQQFLEKVASGNVSSDEEDFNAMEFSGGNFDDAFDIGYSDGRVKLARYLLGMYFE